MSESSRHHVWFERRDYKKRDERKFRNLGGFVIRLDRDVHDYLHLNVPPPPKPMREEMFECAQFVAQRDSYEHNTDVWALDAAMQYFVYRGAEHPEHEQRCHDIRYNLAKQVGIIAGHQTGLAEVIVLRPHIPDLAA